jgi:ribonuclease HI
MQDQVELYADGACRGNPGEGGWGVLLRYKDTEKCLNGYEAHTTNNRMELTAVIQGLQALKKPCSVKVVTDSRYVIDGITKWLPSWKLRGWKTANKHPVKNADLWEALDQIVLLHTIAWEWVKGHNGHPENEKVDGLANQAIDEHISKQQESRDQIG